MASVLAAGGSETSLNCKGRRGSVLGPARLVACRTVYLQAAGAAAPSSVRDALHQGCKMFDLVHSCCEV